ncbi:unnamed protein product [Rotaria socialis]|uniref:Uncharacterized protein n=1 Tax=Rotaria socialis TaxID=392032 RepID=A0A817Q8Y8_9BILA|nr:unnamed protein product [Rotaria socialis]
MSHPSKSTISTTDGTDSNMTSSQHKATPKLLTETIKRSISGEISTQAKKAMANHETSKDKCQYVSAATTVVSTNMSNDAIPEISDEELLEMALMFEKAAAAATAINCQYSRKKRYSTIHDLYCDIWREIFEYFEITDLFITFASVTIAADQVLFNDNNRFFLRGLTLGVDIKDLPKHIPLNSIISLTLHDTFCLNIIEHCIELRSLKLIGVIQWVTDIVRNIPQTNTKLNKLTVITPTIRSLPELLTTVLSVSSLRRLEIHTDELAKSFPVSTLRAAQSEIKQFIIDSGSTVDWNDLSSSLPAFGCIRLLSIGLIDRCQKSIVSFIFQMIHTLSLGLLEVSFNWIIQLVAKIPCLAKLKLSGLVDSDGFVVNQRWICLLESSLTLLRIFVNLSLEQSEESYHCEKIQAPLRALSSSLICDCNDNDCNLYNGNGRQWWYLTGMITKH